MITINELYRKGYDILVKNNIADAKIDAKLLLLFAFNMTTSEYLMNYDKEADNDMCENYLALIEQRATHYPLQYITGTQEFMGIEFMVNEHVLIPRWETEMLVEEVLKECDKFSTVLDMCTGSGCIITSVKKLGKVYRAVGVDISKEAINVAMFNALKNDVDIEYVCSDLFTEVKGTYDIIVSNPPYIKTKVIEGLMPEVRRFEPMLALDGTEDGLHFYRRIIEDAPKYLKDNGWIFFEIGHDQGKDVATLLAKNDEFKEIQVIKDYAGNSRIVKAKFERNKL